MGRFPGRFVAIAAIFSVSAAETLRSSLQNALSSEKIGVAVSTHNQLWNQTIASDQAIKKLQNIQLALGLNNEITKVKLFTATEVEDHEMLDYIVNHTQHITDVTFRVNEGARHYAKYTKFIRARPDITFHLSIGNEPSDSEGVVESITNAARDYKDHYKTRPNVRITVPLAMNKITSDPNAFKFREAMQYCDYLTFNPYPFFAAKDNIDNADYIKKCVDGTVLKEFLDMGNVIARSLGVKMVVGETGWPSYARESTYPQNPDEKSNSVLTNLENSEKFYKSAVQVINDYPDVEAGYLFTAYDEEQKAFGEKHFGILMWDGTRKW
mmetsp:Transcript_16329/g.35544  ORF Transcript_16329/g.35544 Transcript_16329/m.35544 type:complete len:325 (-) Transcript_16329:42-1016(-)